MQLRLSDGTGFLVTIDELDRWSRTGLFKNHYYHDIVHINCSREGITQLPTLLPEFLQALYCESNSLTQLPILPPTLRILDCTRNRLQKLPGMRQCTTLEEIRCSHNYLRTFPPYIPDSVITMDASSNMIVDFENATYISVRLQLLDISGNFIDKTPACLASLPDRAQVNLFGNRFHQRIWRTEQLSDEEIAAADRFDGTRVRWQNNQIGTLHDGRERNQITIPYNTVRRRRAPPVNPTDLKRHENVYASTQSVHASSVQTSANTSLKVILNAHPDEPKIPWKTLVKEISTAFSRWFITRKSYESILTDWCTDPKIHSAEGISFYTLLERVWTIIKHHAEHKELTKVLKAEVDDAEKMCFTGRFTRIINCLCGFVEGIQVGISLREQLQIKVSKIAREISAMEVSVTQKGDDGEEQKIDPENIKQQMAVKRVEEVLDELSIVDEAERNEWLSAVEYMF